MKLYYYSSMSFLRTLLMFVFVFLVSIISVSGSYANVKNFNTSNQKIDLDLSEEEFLSAAQS